MEQHEVGSSTCRMTPPGDDGVLRPHTRVQGGEEPACTAPSVLGPNSVQWVGGITVSNVSMAAVGPPQPANDFLHHISTALCGDGSSASSPREQHEAVGRRRRGKRDSVLAGDCLQVAGLGGCAGVWCAHANNIVVAHGSPGGASCEQCASAAASNLSPFPPSCTPPLCLHLSRTAALLCCSRYRAPVYLPCPGAPCIGLPLPRTVTPRWQPQPPTCSPHSVTRSHTAVGWLIAAATKGFPCNTSESWASPRHGQWFPPGKLTTRYLGWSRPAPAPEKVLT